MCKVLYHRGPDDEGVFIDDDINLGNRRLSIIDVSGGHQPIHNEDESIWIVFNGEIYNYLFLRAALEQMGHKFYTDSDTEVIVHLFEEYGAYCVEKLRGMFAFAIWDRNAKELILARDIIGIKPLYYTFFDEKLIFGSEIKSLLQFKEIKRELNLRALHYYLSLQYTPAPLTLFLGIKKLPPGHILRLKKGSITLSQYKDLSTNFIKGLNRKGIKREIKNLLRESVQLRLMSEVPLGVFLSGGLDSSSILAEMSNIVDEQIKTFSIRFPGKKDDDASFSRKVADHFETEHYEIDMNSEVLRYLPKMIWHFDDLVSDAGALPYFALSKFAKKYVTVILTGDGGDEILGGYHKYNLLKKGILASHVIPKTFRVKVLSRIAKKFPETSTINGIPKFLRKSKEALEFLSLEKDEQYLIDSIFNDTEKVQLYDDQLFSLTMEKTVNAFHPYIRKVKSSNSWFYLDLKFLLGDFFLMRTDKMTMANSIEARVPFLDQELVTFSMKIPYSVKMKSTRFKKKTKPILREIMVNSLPEIILSRKKAGINVPLKIWYEDYLRYLFSNILLDSETQKRQYFKNKTIRKIIAWLDTHKSWRLSRINKLWVLLNFEIWHRIFMDQDNLQNPNLDLNAYL